MLGKIKEVKGCASLPHTSDSRTIITINNMSGEYESVAGNVPIAKVYPRAKDEYRKWWRNQQGFKLGEILTTQVQSDTEIANVLICVTDEDGDDSLEETAVKAALNKLGQHCSYNKLNAHINKLPNDDAWKIVEDGLKEYLVKRGVNVTVYSE